MIDKHELTRKLIRDTGITYQTAMSTWWKDIRKFGGLELTKDGYAALTQSLKITCYRYDMEGKAKLTTRHQMRLSRELKFPYYIEYQKQQPKTIYLFGSRESMLMNLYDDIGAFLNAYS